ncbi:hypothetical protein F4776DRAFT_153609 [Hypoxylon sp. NC0597]|nr:hypothetical protein F4776DRAFT_153609 [Hypoxylon sp. NC0597]
MSRRVHDCLSIQRSNEDGRFRVFLPPGASETDICCCSTQLCVVMLTSTAFPTVTCESGTSTHLQSVKIPSVLVVGNSVSTISIFWAFAPLFQHNNQIRDLLTTAETSNSSNDDARILTSRIMSPSAPQTLPAGSSQKQGPSASNDMMVVQREAMRNPNQKS